MTGWKLIAEYNRDEHGEVILFQPKSGDGVRQIEMPARVSIGYPLKHRPPTHWMPVPPPPETDSQ